ncbi:MAG: FecR domain-containing protein [Spirochaetaceae bacterium]
MKPLLLSALLLLPALLAFSTEDPVGEVVYVEGSPGLIRRGTALDDPVDFGTRLLNYDQVTTGAADFVEVAIDPATGIDATIRVHPASSFYLDISSLQSNQRGGIELLAGTVSLNVTRLLGESELEVRTQGAIMGVRGTEFDVAVGINGDLLVTASEGRVVCRVEDGGTLFAMPNQAVERGFDGRFRNIPIAVSDIETFRREWLEERIEAFRGSPLRVLRYYSGRYYELRGRFNQAYRDLLENRAVLDKWMQEDRRGIVGSRAEQLREKREIIAELLRLRRVLVVFERVYYRLAELEANLPPGAAGRPMADGRTVGEFLADFRRDRRVLARRMQTVRYIFRLYAVRNAGSVPTETGESTFSEDSFTDPDEFFRSDPFGN